MKPIDQVHFRVIDKGLFLPIARRLAREAGKVSYFTPHEKAFPTIRDFYGDGFPEIERVDSIWQDKETVDCFVFPDIGFAHEQEELISQGFPVWGARQADGLEIYRGKFLKALGTTELPVPPHTTLVGMEALRDYLRKQEDKYIKISRFRGDWETMHWRDWEQDEGELEARAVRLGPFKEKLTFFVFDKIETEIEDGYDGYCIDGQWPSLALHGMEAKDKAYLCSFQKFEDFPPEVRCINDSFGPILGSMGYRGAMSSEARITKDGQTFFIDPTLRFGSPPSQVEAEMISNLPEVIYKGAQGILVDPVPAAKFGVQGLLSLSGDRNAWRAVRIPEELDQWVKCGFCSMVDGRLVFPPDPERTDCMIGWLVGIGDTMEAAIDHLRENVEQLPDGLTCEFSALADLLKEVEAAKEQGIELTDEEMPKPESIVADAK